MKGVLFVFQITGYIPTDHLEECEGKKFFQFKMPYTREENDAVSGELRFPYSLCFLSERPTSLPLLERRSAVLLPSEPATAPQSTPSFLIFVDLRSGFTSGCFRPINVHVSMSCLYFNLGGCEPAWAARDAKTPSPS